MKRRCQRLTGAGATLARLVTSITYKQPKIKKQNEDAVILTLMVIVMTCRTVGNPRFPNGMVTDWE
jgi:hypothetical protein